MDGEPSTIAFGPVVADFYDATYAEKDYERECDLIEDTFIRHRPDRVRTILDLGCGSGGHLLPLARRGYELVGVDISPSMLSLARKKVAKERLERVELYEGDTRTIRLRRSFDAALLMFAVLGYQRSNKDVLATLHSVRAHLRSRALLCFDVWYGPTVLTEKPAERRRTIDTSRGQVIRSAQPQLDARRHLCAVEYRFEDPDTGAPLAEERHVVRFFFPLELELFLTESGFELVSLTRFGTLDQEPADDTWNVFVIARAT
jgi:SAM-dependent methyltransferase